MELRAFKDENFYKQLGFEAELISVQNTNRIFN